MVATEPLRIGQVLNLLKGVSKTRKGWTAKCPAHDDSNPSLSVSEGQEGRIVMKCHRGCDFPDIAEALNLPIAALMGAASADEPARSESKPPDEKYFYEDESGAVLFRVVRTYERKRDRWKKTFRQHKRKADGSYARNREGARLVPFRLPELIAAVELGETVYVVEGEKDVLTLASHDIVATCNSGGAGDWRDEYTQFFRGATVAILPDNDDPGRRHAADVAASLASVAASVVTVDLPGLTDAGADVTDWFRLGHDRSELEALVTLRLDSAEAAAEFDTKLVRLPLVDLPPVPQDTINNLPPILRVLCGHYPAGAERTVALMSALSVLSGALPNVRAAHYDNHEGYSPHLMFCLVARSGGGKGVLDQVQRLVSLVDKAVREDARWRLEDWERQRQGTSRKEWAEIGPKPFPSSYLIPANASKTYILNAIQAAGETACIVETEIDTLVGASEQEWGDFSDLIRKAFHHEAYRMGRMGSGDGETMVIERPSLALGISGTWGQFERLFASSVDNGFFNRFAFFVSNAQRGFRSQRPTRSTYERDAWFARASADVVSLYDRLSSREAGRPLTVHLDEAGWDAVDAVFAPAYAQAQESWMSERLQPFVQRVNVMAVRLVALISVWRAHEHNMDIEGMTHMTATPLDVSLALEIASVWYTHGFALLSHLAPVSERPDPLASLPDSVRALYAELTNEFKRVEAEVPGAALGMSPRTVKRHLQALQEAGMLQRQGHSYRKVMVPEIPKQETSDEVPE